MRCMAVWVSTIAINRHSALPAVWKIRGSITMDEHGAGGDSRWIVPHGLHRCINWTRARGISKMRVVIYAVIFNAVLGLRYRDGHIYRKREMRLANLWRQQ
jgi:hypothetical protein